MENTIIKLNGNKSQIRRNLANYGIMLNETETEQLIDTIIANKAYLQNEESANKSLHIPNMPTDCIGFMIMDYRYHISIKKLSLCGIAFFAGKLSHEISDKILEACGVSFKAINEIKELNGEKCIVKETILYHDKVGDENILERFQGKCCNNDLNCSFRQGEQCYCSKTNIKNIFEDLTKREIFKKINSGYKLKW